jgi:hypothetical protein
MNEREFLAYWLAEGAEYARRGDYDWMAAQVPGRRVLEIGCGVGFGTQALLKRGLPVLAIDLFDECLELTRSLVGDVGEQLQMRRADLETLDDATHQGIVEFAPDTVVCWLMGAPAETIGANDDSGQAVATYRERLHRQVAELAAALPGVEALHLVDRTVIPWQAKDLGRDTLVRYHQFKTLQELPFTAARQDALYRKLAIAEADLAQIRKAHPALKSVVPTLASLLARRSSRE